MGKRKGGRVWGKAGSWAGWFIIPRPKFRPNLFRIDREPCLVELARSWGQCQHGAACIKRLMLHPVRLLYPETRVVEPRDQWLFQRKESRFEPEWENDAIISRLINRAVNHSVNRSVTVPSLKLAGGLNVCLVRRRIWVRFSSNGTVTI